MQYGTQKSTGPFRLTVQIAQEPRCPGCAEYLQPCVVEFRNGWAWCQPCVAMGLHSEPWIASVLESESMRACRTVVNGLSFYVPDSSLAAVKSAYEIYEELPGEKCLSVVAGQSDDLYVLTPAGEQAIADHSVGGDEVWNARCLQWRKEIAEAGAPPLGFFRDNFNH